jgi:MSHA biogenesis protein MshP
MTRRTQNAGSALISAIFLIVVLAALGASMASLSNVEHDTAAKSLLAAQAYQSAKTGLEWGIQRVISEPSGTAPARCTAIGAGTNFSPTGTGFGGALVTVSCESSTHGAGEFVYYLTSVAKIGTVGTLHYAERHMEATVSNIP